MNFPGSTIHLAFTYSPPTPHNGAVTDTEEGLGFARSCAATTAACLRQVREAGFRNVVLYSPTAVVAPDTDAAMQPKVIVLEK